MEKKDNISVLWYYFSINESNLLNLGRYVEICDSNMDCHSNEITKSILEIGSEVEHLFKKICRVYSMPEGCMCEYKQCLLEKKPTIVNCELHIKGVSIQKTSSIFPFNEWKNKGAGLSSWHNYSQIKHDRYVTENVATLRTLIELFGIYEILLILYTDLVSDENNKTIPAGNFFRILFPCNVNSSGYNYSLSFDNYFGLI